MRAPAIVPRSGFGARSIALRWSAAVWLASAAASGCAREPHAVAGLASDRAPRRPQEPVPPFPYDQREVGFENPLDGARFAGTLTVPRQPGPHPAVILVTGSGSQDRDESAFGHKPFLLLADRLTRAGYAVLRVDDRGAGATIGDTDRATMQTHAGDVEAGFDFLSRRSEIDPARVGIVGHSEGGVLAALVAAKRREVAFVISLAGPGLPGEKLNPIQIEAMFRASGGFPEYAVEELVAVQRKLVAAIVRGAPDARVLALAREAIELAATHAPGEPDVEVSELDGRARAELGRLLSPWFRSFLATDPAAAWREVRCPVLALNGSLDTQVPARPNLEALAEALRAGGNTDVTTVTRPQLNHAFQHARTGLLDEYATLEETFDPGTIDVMIAWLSDRARPK